MSQFTISIPNEDRSKLTLPPPPMYDKKTGERVEYADPATGRYADVALMKRDNLVYIDEELDVFAHPGSINHYRMMIRRMPWREDLQLILRAARHMMLIGEYSCEYDQREGLSPDMESGFWDVQYVVPIEPVKADADIVANIGAYIPYTLRRRIWIELFAAMGHKVKWGSAVLNVRKKR